MIIAKILKQREKSKGQVLVLVALVFLVLVAFIGLAIDTGMVFITYSNLRRAVDSAALAGASKYRLNVAEIEMVKIAEEFLTLNNVDNATALVTTCDTEPSLCDADGTYVDRKLVKVVASAPVQMSFISVLGFDTITVTAESVSEAASLDVILVLDTSESMTYDEDFGNHDYSTEPLDFRDPRVCNDPANDPSSDGYPGECHPFEEVKQAAVDFVNQLYFPYDRVGVVAFDRWDNFPARLDLTNNKADIIDYIKELQVTPWLQPCEFRSDDKWLAGGCANYIDYGWGPFYYYDCTLLADSGGVDPRTCGATNIGAGMQAANEMFGAGRDSSLWVVVLLTDGAANAAVPRFGGTDDETAPDYFGYCPSNASGTWDLPYCRKGHSNPWGPRPLSGDDDYDAGDFAYDMIDLVADRTDAQGTPVPYTAYPLGDAKKLIFTIGLGDAVTENSLCLDPANDCDPDAGEKLLEYAAEQGDGSYYFAPDANKLKRIFQDIASKIAFRITH